MGGGDLNTKKSWHPSTLKNQERVWAAERAAEQERSRIVELQRERSGEHERDELRALGRRVGTLPQEGAGDKLAWMYNQPNKSGNTEDYLLGKTIDKNYEKLVAEERHSDKTAAPPKNHVEHEVIPFSIRKLRGGACAADEQVDIARKLQEDPLAAIQRRELDARAQLLQNPLRLQQLTKLLRQEEEKRKAKKAKKKSKHKSDLDKLLAEKLTGLQGKKIDISSLLGDKKKKKKKKSRSESNSSDSSSEDEKHKKKKKRKEKEQEKSSKKIMEHSSDSDSERISRRKKRQDSEGEHKLPKKKSRDSADIEQHKSKKHRDSSEIGKKPFTQKIRREMTSDSDDKHSKNHNDFNSSGKKRKSSETSEDLSHNKKSKRESEKRQTEIASRKSKHDSNSREVTKKDIRRYSPSRNSERQKKAPSRTRHSSSDSDSNRRTKKAVERRSRSSSPRRHMGRSKDFKKHHRNSDSDTERKEAHYGLIAADGRKLSTVRHTEDKVKKPTAKKEEVWRRPPVERLSEAEKERRRKEMMDAAVERDVERERNVARHREAARREEEAAKSSNFDTEFATRQAARAASSGTVQQRIRSNVYNIQRSGRHMDVNFAKR